MTIIIGHYIYLQVTDPEIEIFFPDQPARRFRQIITEIRSLKTRGDQYDFGQKYEKFEDVIKKDEYMPSACDKKRLYRDSISLSCFSAVPNQHQKKSQSSSNGHSKVDRCMSMTP
jgi:hypothetical protein